MKNLTSEQIKKIKKLVGYKGRKPVGAADFRPGMRVNSYWDSGCRDYWFLINVRTFACREIPQNGTPFDKLDLTCDALGPDEVLVLSPVFRGRDGRLTIFS
jgi:hypothetical protein